MTGGGGLLAHAMRPALAARGHEVRALGHTDLDVTDESAVREAVAAFRPDWVFHFAADTRVDDCESRPERAHAVNAGGARNAAIAAAERGAAILAISTDYVFSGEAHAPYREDDPTGPINVYGASKLAGEAAIRAAGGRHLIVRTAWLFGPGGGNFVDAILRKARAGETLRVAGDQQGSPTATADLARGLLRLAETAENGTYHVVNAGVASWHELATAAVRAAGLGNEVQRITTAELGRPARRPAYSALDTSKFVAATGAELPHWSDAVARHVQEAA